MKSKRNKYLEYQEVNLQSHLRLNFQKVMKISLSLQAFILKMKIKNIVLNGSYNSVSIVNSKRVFWILSKRSILFLKNKTTIRLISNVSINL